jgi:hypothetical protein
MGRRGNHTVDSESEALRQALRRMPVPEVRPEYVDRALARATVGTAQSSASGQSVLHRFAMSWHTWAGAAIGGVLVAILMLMLLRPVEQPGASAPGLALILHEARDIDVMIDSERALEGATIRIVASGSIALDGFDNDHEIGWQANLERGSNLLSLPVVARSAGKGQLVAIIEHEGRTRRVMINVTVLDTKRLSS